MPSMRENDSRRTDRREEDEQIEGRNPVIEALRAGRPIHKLFVLRGGETGLQHVVAMAKDAGAVIVDCDRRMLDGMSLTGAHQGVIAVCAAHAFATVEEILAAAEESGRPPLIVLCDGIQDPHNLGAIIRSAETAGAQGVIISKHRSAGLTASCAKSAAGALEHVPVARVANLTQTIDLLKEKGIWIYGAAGEASAEVYKTDLTGPTGLVIGSEGFGLSRLVAEHCDALVSIPMLGKINSLNASAACAVLLFEAVRQRIMKDGRKNHG